MINKNSYQSQYTSKREAHQTRYMYTCAQSQERMPKSQKQKLEHTKLRDRLAMTRFDCHGWLHITLSNTNHTAFVKISHGNLHIPYYCIDVPQDIKDFIHENLNMTPSQVWIYIGVISVGTILTIDLIYSYGTLFLKETQCRISHELLFITCGRRRIA